MRCHCQDELRASLLHQAAEFVMPLIPDDDRATKCRSVAEECLREVVHDRRGQCAAGSGSRLHTFQTSLLARSDIASGSPEAISLLEITQPEAISLLANLSVICINNQAS